MLVNILMRAGEAPFQAREIFGEAGDGDEPGSENIAGGKQLSGE